MIRLPGAVTLAATLQTMRRIQSNPAIASPPSPLIFQRKIVDKDKKSLPMATCSQGQCSKFSQTTFHFLTPPPQVPLPVNRYKRFDLPE
ncbi:MAG: hypothetical protein ACK4TA_02840 [Saprospiraceae bacterium]